MKVFLKVSFTAIALVLFFGVFTVAKTNAQNPLPEILKRMETHRNSLKSLHSSVKMVRYNSQLKEAETTEGTATYLPTKGRDALVRIDWTKPVVETLSVVNGKYIVYRPRLGTYITGNSNSAKGSGKAGNALSFMNMSKDQLKSNYDIKYVGLENVAGGTQTWHLELTPKTPQNYKSAELWVDGNGMPIQAKVIESNNDNTTIFLSNLEKNVSIKASVFEVKIPKGTQKIDG